MERKSCSHHRLAGVSGSISILYTQKSFLSTVSAFLKIVSAFGFIRCNFRRIQRRLVHAVVPGAGPGNSILSKRERKKEEM
jgi:hypothetical protein